MGAETPVVLYPDTLAALGVCRALGSKGVPVVVAARDHSTPGQYSRHASRVVRVGAGGHDADPVRFLSELGRRLGRPAVLFLMDDSSLMTVSPHRQELEEWYRFPSAPWDVLRRMMFKDQLYDSLSGVVPVPVTSVPTDEGELAAAARTVGYPAIVKPLLRCLTDTPQQVSVPFDRSFGAKAVRARNWAELKEAYLAARRLGFPVLVQEEIEGPISDLYSVGAYATPAGNLAAAFTSRKLGQVPADFGDGLIVQATRAPELIDLGARALGHFGYHGIADIEFKWDVRAGVFKLLDINPRPWPWIHLPTMCGVNLPYAAYLGTLGRPVAPADFVQRDFAMRWVYTTGLLTFAARSIRAARPGRLLTVLRHAGWARYGTFSFRDPLLRMYASPGYWLDIYRRATAWLREVPREGAAPLRAQPLGAAAVAIDNAASRRNHDV
jgi:predicted ATP-grasp superfamily ATP-dependent carboligase